MSDIMDMEEDSSAEELRYEIREEGGAPCPSGLSIKTTNSMNPPNTFKTGAVNPGAMRKKRNPFLSEVKDIKEESSARKRRYEIREEGGAPCPSGVSIKTTNSMNPPNTFRTGAVNPGAIGGNEVAIKTVKATHKTSMKNKYERLFEGSKLQENETLLNIIYTQLYIIEGEREGVNEQHEVLQIENTTRTQDTQICCNDIFKASSKPRREEKKKIKNKIIKTVLTKGMAGIGKTVSVQKFVLDWAEGKSNQDVDFMFVLPFRELNLIKDDEYSLHRLLLDFHPELQDLDSKMYEECKVVFIFDGLDESRVTLKFSDAQKVSDINESSSVDVLMSNLIRGDLLPSALIWITSRPAAANQIPSEYINRVTEIQGFDDPQKEEYFRKRISDEHQANTIISHIKRSRSLHTMCHIPVFCWVSSTVLQNILEEDLSAEIPQTLTEMYIHFLLIQINMRNQKYEDRDPEKLLKSNREVILKLAEVAYNQLMKGNVMFYEEDLIESGIDVTEASVYSGICTEIFKEESVIHQRKVYSFIHLSFQEFLAAFYEFYCHLHNKKEVLKTFLISEQLSLNVLLKAAVDKSLQTGRLDLFLRFLLGIALESNQKLLEDLLSHTEDSRETYYDIAAYIKDTIIGDKQLSADKSINLFLCLLELKDQTLYRKIQSFVNSDRLPSTKLSLPHCSAIAYMLQMSDQVLDKLNLKKFNTSDEGRRRLIPAVRNCRKALLSDCKLTDQCCESVTAALQFNSSLRELDLSNNDLKDSGGKMLFDALKSPKCELEILRLSICNFTDQCCESLASALQSSNSCLKELDLSNNDLKDSGVKLIADALKSPNCKLEKLRLSGCMVTKEGCSHLASVLSLTSSRLRELDLSYNYPGDAKLEQCKLEKLCLDHGGENMIKPGLHKYFCDLTLDPNTVHNQLSLSESNKKLLYNSKPMSHPDHPERFDGLPQVLCKERLSERSYWEAEWSGLGDMVVSYKGIPRKGKGDDVRFGTNDKSWILCCFAEKLYTWHIVEETDITPPAPPSNKFGVYLDEPAGILSFYSISDTNTLRHLHTFNTTFTEPLYAGFVLYTNSVSLCDVKHQNE
ncbi:NACHT, LRR and PYD domains-containing protein 3-like isoform X2 [Carassius carassius]|uniref:NACHT, LRR and PYD domains-containing protein 3-like isoform X2 n=1 Tax=Carassius carassius TaxID=217509 RepID=UPI0028689C09|nr:NACHT, LRR and PYD domains-containing protein 3-like isoform X2 [Carassius carassius]